jgi:hypothetical protein
MADERIERVTQLLDEAESAHATYEQEQLGGQRDEQWTSWYAGHVVEHDLGAVLGTTPTIEDVAAVLTEATDDLEREGGGREWSEFAAERVVDRLG